MTLDTGPLASTQSSSCKFCARTVESIAKLRAEGQKLVGAEILLMSSEIDSADHRYGADLAVDVRVLQEPGRVEDASGNTVEKLTKPQQTQNRLWLRFANGRWEILQIGFVK